MSDIAIRVENLGKMYRIGAREKQLTTLRARLQNLILSPFDYLRTTLRRATEEETLWALKDVSFEVKHGEVLGVIGRNGAGKSTLLKILSRITEPTTGYADVYGRVGSLLEVGTGFHPELTGRENVYLNGTILGMKRAEIDRQFDEIVDFAGVEKFIDTPVKRYSSGMQVRLGFAVAAHLEPEILLVDEVLAVGDVAFQKKCLGKMGAVAKDGRTILFVSHNMQAVRQLCERSILLAEGGVAFDGLSAPATTLYFGAAAGLNAETALGGTPQTSPQGGVQIVGVQFLDYMGEPCSQFDRSETVRIAVTFSVSRPLRQFDASIAVMHTDGVRVFSETLSDHTELASLGTGRYRMDFELDLKYLKPESYFLTIYLLDSGRALDNIDGVPFPEIQDPSADSLIEARRWGVVRIPIKWLQIREYTDDFFHA